MDPIDNQRGTAQELVQLAGQRGLDLLPVLHDWMFRAGDRWIFFWRKKDGRPGTGGVEVREGTLHYNMQGAVSVSPRLLKFATGATHGIWYESGTFASLEEALALLIAWLIDRKEVDDLPARDTNRRGLG